MDEDAVGVEADRLGVVRVDRGDEHLGGREADRSRREERVRDGVVVERPAMLCRTALAPGRPQLLQRTDVLAELRSGRLPFHAEPPFDVSLHLGAEAETEASL